MDKRKPPKDSHLNPDLSATTDETYGPDQEGHDPMESISSSGKEGRGWPMVWVIAAVICALVSLYILFG